jgi:hypothetical protein
MHSVARSSNLFSVVEDIFMFGILKQKYCYLENTSQESLHIFIHPYLDSITGIINITLLILRLLDVSLVSLSSWNGVHNYNVTVLPKLKPEFYLDF